MSSSSLPVSQHEHPLVNVDNLLGLLDDHEPPVQPPPGSGLSELLLEVSMEEKGVVGLEGVALAQGGRADA